MAENNTEVTPNTDPSVVAPTAGGTAAGSGDSSSNWSFLLQEGYGYVESVIFAVIILIAGHFASRVVSNALKGFLNKREKLDAQIRLLSVRLVRIVILLITLVAVLGEFGIETASIIAVLGSLGLAVGLALQGSLSNVASGVLLMVIRPFTIGDVIKSGGNIYVIDEVSLFSTRAHLFDGPKVIIPNNNLWGSEIVNLSQAHDDLRRIDEEFGIAYTDDIDKAFGVIAAVLDADERYLTHPERLLAVNSLGDSSVNILCRVWTKPGDWYAAKLDLLKNVKQAFDRENISIPFPQRDVHVIQGSKSELPTG